MSLRAEMRREKHKKDPIYTLSASQIEQIKTDAVNDGVDRAFKLLLGIPTLVIMDKFGQLMKKDGREALFLDLVLETYDSYVKGYFSLEDLDELIKENGVVIKEELKKWKK